MGLPVLKTDHEDSIPGREPGLAEAEWSSAALDQETQPVPAVAVRDGHIRGWAANLGVLDVVLAVFVALLIGVDAFVGLGGLRVTGTVNTGPGTGLATGTATHSTGTPAPTVASQATATPPPIPSGVIKFSGSGEDSVLAAREA